MTTTIVTHGGSFHPDDVFAVATLLLKYPEAKVVRTRDKEVIASADIVVDVGMTYDPAGRRFDHHQAGGAGARANGIPYASFGLVWKEFGSELAGREAARLIDEKLVMSIDAPDNGVSVYTERFENVRPYTIGDFMYSYFVSGEGDEQTLYHLFMSLVEISKGLLEREIKKAEERVRGMKEVEDIFHNTADKRLIVLEKDLPWEPVLVTKPEAIFVIYQRREGNWGVKGVPVANKGFERRKLLPESWAGKEKEELRAVSGVADAVFCHQHRFLAGAETKEGALKLAEIALNS